MFEKVFGYLRYFATGGFFGGRFARFNPEVRMAVRDFKVSRFPEGALEALEKLPDSTSYGLDLQDFINVSRSGDGWQNVAVLMMKKFNYSDQDLNYFLSRFSRKRNLPENKLDWRSEVVINEIFRRVVAAGKVDDFDKRFTAPILPVVQRAIVDKRNNIAADLTDLMIENLRSKGSGSDVTAALFGLIDLACDSDNAEIATMLSERVIVTFPDENSELRRKILTKVCLSENGEFDELRDFFIKISGPNDLIASLIEASKSGIRPDIYQKLADRINLDSLDADEFLKILLSFAKEGEWENFNWLLEKAKDWNDDKKDELVAAKILVFLHQKNSPDEVKNIFIEKFKPDFYQAAALCDVNDVNLIEKILLYKGEFAKPNSEGAFVDVYGKICVKVGRDRANKRPDARYEELRDRLGVIFNGFISPQTKFNFFCEMEYWDEALEVLKQNDSDFLYNVDHYEVFAKLVRSPYQDSRARDMLFSEIIDKFDFSQEILLAAMHELILKEKSEGNQRYFEQLAVKFISSNSENRDDEQNSGINNTQVRLLYHCFSKDCKLVNKQIIEDLAAKLIESPGISARDLILMLKFVHKDSKITESILTKFEKSCGENPDSKRGYFIGMDPQEILYCYNFFRIGEESAKQRNNTDIADRMSQMKIASDPIAVAQDKFQSSRFESSTIRRPSSSAMVSRYQSFAEGRESRDRH